MYYVEHKYFYLKPTMKRKDIYQGLFLGEASEPTAKEWLTSQIRESRANTYPFLSTYSMLYDVKFWIVASLWHLFRAGLVA